MEDKLSEEIWVPLFGYEDKYEISSNGEVRVKSRNILDKDGNILSTLKSTNLQIKANLDNTKYVILHDGSKYRKENVEDLIRQSFVCD